MRPSEGRGARQKIAWAIQSIAFSVVDGLTEMLGAPVYDDGLEQIKACHSEVLAFGDAFTDFTLATDAQHIFRA